MCFKNKTILLTLVLNLWAKIKSI